MGMDVCNFFTRYREPRNIQAAFRFPELPNDPPRWVVRPTDTERVVSVGKDGQRHSVPMRWGLVPYWAKNLKAGPTTFNYRSEEFTSKAAFTGPWERGYRCLVPCDGFFEFTGEQGSKQPWLFRPKDGRLMAFAGIWDSWTGPKELPLVPLLSFSIATCAPNATVAPIHNRMPVLLTEEWEWDAWLATGPMPDEMRQMLLAPALDDLLEAFPVSRDLLRTKEPTADILVPIS